MTLAGRRALVTGSGAGLGYEIARGLAEAGATVQLNGRSAERLAEPLARLRSAGLDVEPRVFDVTDAGATEAALAAAGPLDVLVGNVAHRDRRGVLDLDGDAFEALVRTDLVAAYALVRAWARRRVAQGLDGSVVLVSSVVGGTLGSGGDVAYNAAKAGIEGLVRSLAVDLGPRGIRVNALAPGAFATAANAERFATPEWQAWIARRAPLGRFGTPAEIAGAAVFLASDAASYVTGQVLVVDGGLSRQY